MSTWDILGIAPTNDKRAIKRAYSSRLKQTNPEDNPEGFQQLREAYESANNWADYASQEDHDQTVEVTFVADDTPPLNALPLQTMYERMGTASNPEQPDMPEAAKPERITRAENPDISGALAEVPQLIEQLIQIAQEHGAAGVDVGLQTNLGSAALENLDARTAFEEALLKRLAGGDSVEGEALLAVYEHFAWDERGAHIPQLYPFAFENITRRVQAWRDYVALQQDGGSWAAQTLLAPYNPKRFARQARWCKRYQAMRELIHNIQRNKPDLVRLYLNTETYRWWQEAINEERTCYMDVPHFVLMSVIVWVVFLVLASMIFANDLNGYLVMALALFATGIAMSFPFWFKWLWNFWHTKVVVALAKIEEYVTTHALKPLLPNPVLGGLKARHFALSLALQPLLHVLLLLTTPLSNVSVSWALTISYFGTLVFVVSYFRLKLASSNHAWLTNTMVLGFFYGWLPMGGIFGLLGLTTSQIEGNLQVAAVLSVMVCLFWGEVAKQKIKTGHRFYSGLHFYLYFIGSGVLAGMLFSKIPHVETASSLFLQFLLGALTLSGIRLAITHFKAKSN